MLVQVDGDSEDSAGIGTGVIVNADGTILTANHVVDGAASIKVTYADGTTSDATLTGADPTMDIATLAPGDPARGARAGDARRRPATIGDPVVAVGNPFGLVDSTTPG